MKCLGRNYHRGHFLPRTFPSSDFSKPGSSPLALHLLSLRPRPSPKFPSLCPLACTSDYTRPLSIHTTYCFSLSGMEVPALSCCLRHLLQSFIAVAQETGTLSSCPGEVVACHSTRSPGYSHAAHSLLGWLDAVPRLLLTSCVRMRPRKLHCFPEFPDGSGASLAWSFHS